MAGMYDAFKADQESVSEETERTMKNIQLETIKADPEKFHGRQFLWANQQNFGGPLHWHTATLVSIFEWHFQVDDRLSYSFCDLENTKYSTIAALYLLPEKLNEANDNHDRLCD